jgi:hypothetical protein
MKKPEYISRAVKHEKHVQKRKTRKKKEDPSYEVETWQIDSTIDRPEVYEYFMDLTAILKKKLEKMDDQKIIDVINLVSMGTKDNMTDLVNKVKRMLL